MNKSKEVNAGLKTGHRALDFQADCRVGEAVLPQWYSACGTLTKARAGEYPRSAAKFSYPSIVCFGLGVSDFEELRRGNCVKTERVLGYPKAMLARSGMFFKTRAKNLRNSPDRQGDKIESSMLSSEVVDKDGSEVAALFMCASWVAN